MCRVVVPGTSPRVFRVSFSACGMVLSFFAAVPSSEADLHLLRGAGTSQGSGVCFLAFYFLEDFVLVMTLVPR